jgi:hypothetical protein
MLGGYLQKLLNFKRLVKFPQERGGGGELRLARGGRKKINIYINDERVWHLPTDGWDVAELHFLRG